MCYFSFLAFFPSALLQLLLSLAFFAFFIATVVPFAMVAKKEEREERGGQVIASCTRSSAR